MAAWDLGASAEEIALPFPAVDARDAIQNLDEVRRYVDQRQTAAVAAEQVATGVTDFRASASVFPREGRSRLARWSSPLTRISTTTSFEDGSDAAPDWTSFEFKTSASAAPTIPMFCSGVQTRDELPSPTTAQPMVAYALERVDNGEPMPGLIAVHDRAAMGQVLDDLVLIAECVDLSELFGQVWFVP